MPKSAPIPSGTYISNIPLSEVIRWPRNPKEHDHGEIDASMERFGFVAPLTYDEKTGRIVAGHGRLETLQKRKQSGKPPPARILVDEKTGEWLVPVIRGVAFKDEKEAEAYLIADNRLAEKGGWDEKALAAMLAGLGESADDFEGVGYSKDEVDLLVAAAAAATAPDAGDDLPSKQSDRMDRYNDATIKQIVLYFENEQYEQVVAKLELIRKATGLASNSEVFEEMLKHYEATAPKAGAA